VLRQQRPPAAAGWRAGAARAAAGAAQEARPVARSRRAVGHHRLAGAVRPCGPRVHAPQLHARHVLPHLRVGVAVSG
jgi:hypothetical protein